MSIAAALEANLRARVEQNLPNVTARMVDDTRQACPRQTGQLADSIGADPWQAQGDRYTSMIRATAPYAAFQEFGTGVFGPTGQRIVPLTAKALVFEWPKAGGLVAFRSVAGSPATRFFFGDDGTAMQGRFENALASEWVA